MKHVQEHLFFYSLGAVLIAFMLLKDLKPEGEFSAGLIVVVTFGLMLVCGAYIGEKKMRKEFQDEIIRLRKYEDAFKQMNKNDSNHNT